MKLTMGGKIYDLSFTIPKNNLVNMKILQRCTLKQEINKICQMWLSIENTLNNLSKKVKEKIFGNGFECNYDIW